MARSNALKGERLTLQYVPLDQAVEWEWKDNPKLHDLEAIASSIRQHGFKDPSKYEPVIDGFGHGNGRAKAVALLRDRGESPPKGIPFDDNGAWYYPVLMGVDAGSRAAAEAYAIDHNNLTMKGGGFSIEEMSRLWAPEGLARVLETVAEAGMETNSFRVQDMMDLLSTVSGPPPVLRPPKILADPVSTADDRRPGAPRSAEFQR